MSRTKYQDPIQTVSGKIFGKQSNISQRRLFGIYDSTYCYQNKPDHWSDAQTAHRQKMGAASLYAKLLLQDPEFAAQATAYRLDLLHRLTNPRSAADKHLKPYLRNQQMLTSLIYNRLSANTTPTAVTSATPATLTADATSSVAPSAFPAALILNGYARYRTCRDFDRPAVLAQLATELTEALSTNPDLSASINSLIHQ
ncbi:MAG: hypothetical protein IJP76_00195 [Paludibacteraceae bacterium]|nr:hypothetical protein [Paludibacteraceae bacterium]